MAQPHRIMLVDDETGVLHALKREFAGMRAGVDTFTDPDEALLRTQEHDYDLVIADYRMPRTDGVTLLGQIRRLRPETMRILLSAHADLDGLMGAINEAEIFRFLPKPWHRYELLNAAAQAIRHREVLAENRRLAEQVRARERTLAELEQAHPELFRLHYAEDGSIVLDPGKADG